LATAVMNVTRTWRADGVKEYFPHSPGHHGLVGCLAASEKAGISVGLA
jgi:hypothetical protein